MTRLNGRSAHINFDLPEDVAPAEIASFISEALESWGGSFVPDHPLFTSLKVNSVTIGDIKYVAVGDDD